MLFLVLGVSLSLCIYIYIYLVSVPLGCMPLKTVDVFSMCCLCRPLYCPMWSFTLSNVFSFRLHFVSLGCFCVYCLQPCHALPIPLRLQASCRCLLRKWLPIPPFPLQTLRMPSRSSLLRKASGICSRYWSGSKVVASLGRQHHRQTFSLKNLLKTYKDIFRYLKTYLHQPDT